MVYMYITLLTQNNQDNVGKYTLPGMLWANLLVLTFVYRLPYSCKRFFVVTIIICDTYIVGILRLVL